jgi:hypothetical protein
MQASQLSLSRIWDESLRANMRLINEGRNEVEQESPQKYQGVS